MSESRFPSAKVEVQIIGEIHEEADTDNLWMSGDDQRAFLRPTVKRRFETEEYIGNSLVNFDAWLHPGYPSGRLSHPIEIDERRRLDYDPEDVEVTLTAPVGEVVDAIEQRAAEEGQAAYSVANEWYEKAADARHVTKDTADLLLKALGEVME